MTVFASSRLQLRRFSLADVAAMAQVFGDPAVMKYGFGVKSAEWIEQWISGCQHDYAELGFGRWAVVPKHHAQPIGYCGLATTHIDEQLAVTIGYRLAQSFWGQGYGSEAVLATLTYAHNQLRLPRIVATIDPHNAASIRVAEKAGMTYEKEVMFPNYDYPDRLYVSVH